MNYVHLSPHFPPNYHLFAVNLSRLGARVLGLADESYEMLAPELASALTEYYRVDDLHSYDQLLRACGYFTHRYGKIDRIDSHTEYWLETEASLRSDFNIFGPKRPDMARIKRKSQMRAAFIEAGVPVAHGALYAGPEQARDFVRSVGLPVVAKPDIGVGAANTYKIAGADDLERFIATRPPMDFILEEFVDGEICTFDGLTDRDGNPVFLSSLHYSQGIMETVNEDLHVYYYTLRDIPRDLEDAGRRALRVFDVRERFFHIEFFRLRDSGQLIGLELNLRPPGGPTVDMWNYANEIDLYWEWANVVVNNRFTETYNTKYHCCYVGRKFSKRYLHNHEQIMDAFGHCIVHQQFMSPVFSVAMGDYAYIVRTPDLDEALAAAHYIQELES
jgi:biotin carboxylase